MNTPEEQPLRKRQPDGPFELPAESEQVNVSQILVKSAQLEAELSYAKDVRREERFYWICVSLFLLDAILFKFLDSMVGFLIFLFIQLAVLAALAKRLGVDWAAGALDRSSQWISEHFSSFK